MMAGSISKPAQHRRGDARPRVRAGHARTSAADPVKSAIDAALLAATPRPLHELLSTNRALAVPAVADRVYRRAIQLARRGRIPRATLIQAREAIILALYAWATPKGWVAAWCDGSTKTENTQHLAGVGAILADCDGRVTAQAAHKLTGLPALEAEIAAADAALALVLDAGETRVRLHTDCRGLVDLWRSRRSDPRLAALCARAVRLERLQVRLVPRQHNQPAHRLAHAARGRGSGDGTAGDARLD